MTARDHKDIQNLHYFHRFLPASIAKLYGLSAVRIHQILKESTLSVSDTECMLCGLEDEVKLFYIDGNEDNHNPQNLLMLCEADKRRIVHLQLRRIKSLT
jgi:hypothetical protein